MCSPTTLLLSEHFLSDFYYYYQTFLLSMIGTCHEWTVRMGREQLTPNF